MNAERVRPADSVPGSQNLDLLAVRSEIDNAVLFQVPHVKVAPVVHDHAVRGRRFHGKNPAFIHLPVNQLAGGYSIQGFTRQGVEIQDAVLPVQGNPVGMDFSVMPLPLNGDMVLFRRRIGVMVQHSIILSALHVQDDQPRIVGIRKINFAMLTVHAQVINIGIRAGGFRQGILPDKLVRIEVIHVQCRNGDSLADHGILRINHIKPVSVRNHGLHAHKRISVSGHSLLPPVGFLIRIRGIAAVLADLRHGARNLLPPAGKIDKNPALVRHRYSGHLRPLERGDVLNLRLRTPGRSKRAHEE